jgi:hypothetical protein
LNPAIPDGCGRRPVQRVARARSGQPRPACGQHAALPRAARPLRLPTEEEPRVIRPISVGTHTQRVVATGHTTVRRQVIVAAPQPTGDA